MYASLLGQHAGLVAGIMVLYCDLLQADLSNVSTPVALHVVTTVVASLALLDVIKP
jgi:hypothetical protein